MQFVDATDLALTEATALSDYVATSTLLVRTAVFELRCPLEDASALALTRVVDAVLLVVSLGKTELDRAQRLIQLIGRDRIVGCIALRESEPSRKRAAPKASSGGTKVPRFRPRWARSGKGTSDE
ncbi:MAG: hypothetical protein HY791_17810 [Deltaproteobacteria bacterium]|nr:hypothetical protein [Deltaproteobacteria bacterium]